MNATQKCPYCAEEIPTEAVRCRYCRSRLTALDPGRWYRDYPERRLAGVTVAISKAFTMPVAVVRIAFVVLSFVHLLGPVIYGALWLIIPFGRDEESPLERCLGRAKELAAQLRGGRPETHPFRADPSDTNRGAAQGAAPMQESGGQ